MTVDPATQRRQRLAGIGLMCLAVAFLTCIDAIAKYLNAHMDTVQVVWARYTFAFLLAFAISNPWTRPGLLRTRRPGLHVARAVLMVAGTSLRKWARPASKSTIPAALRSYDLRRRV